MLHVFSPFLLVFLWLTSKIMATAFAFSPDLQHVAVVAADGVMRVIDFVHERLIETFQSYFGALSCVSWSPDGKYILVRPLVQLLYIPRCTYLKHGTHSFHLTNTNENANVDMCIDRWTRRSCHHLVIQGSQDHSTLPRAPMLCHGCGLWSMALWRTQLSLRQCGRRCKVAALGL